jgi:hypothetical protein
MSQLPGNPEPATKNDLHKLEARMDARFQAVNSRFSTVDRRHDGLRSRVDTMEDQWQVFGARVEHRLDVMELRFDATDRRIDVVFDKVALEIKDSRRDTRRSMMLSLAGTAVTTATVCIATLV